MAGITQPEDLDDRKAAILRAVVEEYVETAQPVGSQTIARATDLGVSSATVRNDMMVLEREGYLRQPHTSAGRVPTDRGYRFFVDHLAEDEPLPLGSRRAVSEFFASAHQALEELLLETGQLLARVSRHASVIVGPQPDAAKLRSIQLVSLQPRLVLVVAVLSNGAIEKQVLHLDDDVDDALVASVNRVLGAQLVGQPWSARPTFVPTGTAEVDRVAGMAHAALCTPTGTEVVEPFYVGGVSRLAAEHDAFSTAESAARLLEILEHQVVVVSLVRELLDAGVAVSIGSENRVDALSECSIVVAPYEIDGVPVGIVGVLGPTRMNYRHALAAVSTVSTQLGRHLS
jgi:heat-inducible transcriptional repressor